MIISLVIPDTKGEKKIQTIVDIKTYCTINMLIKRSKCYILLKYCVILANYNIIIINKRNVRLLSSKLFHL